MNLFYLHHDTSKGSRLELFATEAQRQAAQKRLLVAEDFFPRTGDLAADWSAFCEEASRWNNYYTLGEIDAPVAPLKDRHLDHSAPLYPIDRYDAVEVHGVREIHEDGETRCEVDDADPQFFSVYLHFREGHVDCVGDFTYLVDALSYAAELALAHRWPLHTFNHPTPTTP